MYRIGVHAQRGLHDRVDLEVAVGGTPRSYAEGPVGKSSGCGFAIGIRCRQHRLDTQCPASADDAQCDLATIGNENSP